LKAEQSGFLKMTTRRLAAILAADVAGFSALMERDEEGAFARIGNLRREVIEPYLSEHQGRLIKTRNALRPAGAKLLGLCLSGRSPCMVGHSLSIRLAECAVVHTVSLSSIFISLAEQEPRYI
jgi:hypothetical protein